MKPLRMSLLLSLFVVLVSIALHAQVPYEYTTNPNSPITDFTTTSSSITITDAFTITDLNVMVDISHDFAADLIITIAKAGGPTVVLSANNGGSYDNYMTTIFDDQAAGYMNGGSIVGTVGAQFNGIYKPQNPLSVFNGLSGTGTWTFSVSDGAFLNEGILKKWGLIFNRIAPNVQPYKDVRVGADLNWWGWTRYPTWLGGWVDGVQTMPPLTVQGSRPFAGITTFAGVIQNSAIASATNVITKQTGSSGNVLFNQAYDFPASAGSNYWIYAPIYLNGTGMHKYNFSLFQRYGLFMARDDDQTTLQLPVTPGSLAWDNGKMQWFFNYTAPECDAITVPIYATQLLTSIDIYQGYGVELVTPGTGKIDVDVWSTLAGVPSAVIASSNVHTLPPQATKWVTYPFNPPVSLTTGTYGFGMCVIADPAVGGVALGLDGITSMDPMFGRYEGMMNQWYTLGGPWFEEVGGFLTNKMIRPNFITGVDVGVYTIDSPNGTSGGPQAVTVTFKSYNHQPQLPNLVATGRVTIKNSTGTTVYTSERRIYLTPYGSQTMSFDLFTASAAGDYTVTALIDRINNVDDENLINNSYTRSFTLLFPGTPIIVSEDGSLNNDQRDNIAKAMRAKGLEVQFQNRTFDGNPLDKATQVVWVGDVNTLDETAVRSFIDNGNYFALLSQKAVSDLGNQVFNKLRPASEIAYESTVANKLVQAQSADAMRRMTTGAKPAGNVGEIGKLVLVDGPVGDALSQRLELFTQTIQSAEKKLAEQGPAPKWQLDNNVISGRGTISLQAAGSIKVRESLLGNLPFAEVLSNRNFSAPSVESKPLPTEFALEQNYPNPFNPSTNIAYTLPTESRLTIHIYDVLGRQVATLFEGIQNQGRYMMTWDGEGSYGSPLASGVYFYRLEAVPTNGSAPYNASKKMILAR